MTKDVTVGVGEQFARCLAAKDAAGLKALLRSEVDFRALTPGKAWEGTDASSIVDDTILGTWFADDRRIVELVSVQSDRVEHLERVGYRFRVTKPDGDFIIEQQAYLKAERDQITWLRIMCTGFLPVGP
jgi:hypothetical protein